MWDMAIFSVVPGLQMAAPRDEATLVAALRRAVDVDDAPTLVRYPKGELPSPAPAITTVDDVDMLQAPLEPDVLLVAVGTMSQPCVGAAEILAGAGIRAAVAAPVWVKPVPQGVVGLARSARLCVVVEDGVRVGGIAALVSLALADGGCITPVRSLGVPAQFLVHASRSSLLSQFGLTAQGIAEAVTAWLGQVDR
jgi:1-deoxy-D-xylulose-5-phosphate synthase